jgi:hypothetical protein
MRVRGSDRRTKAPVSAVFSTVTILFLILLIMVGRDQTVEAAKKIKDETKEPVLQTIS